MARDKFKTRALTIPEKIEIIKEVDKGEKKKKDIASMFCIPATTLSAILKDRDFVVREYTRVMHEAGLTWYKYEPLIQRRPDHQCHKSNVTASRTIPCVPSFRKLTLYKPVSGKLQKDETHCLDLSKPASAVIKRRHSSESETSDSRVTSPRCCEEGYASTSGTSRGQSYEDHLSILPTAEEDGLVCEPEEFEEKYQPPMEYYESQAGTSEHPKRGHETEESEDGKRGPKSRDMMLSDEMLQEEMIPEEVTVTPHIPTTLIDSSSSNSSTTRMMAAPPSPTSGRASPDVVSTPYQQPNGVQQRPAVCDSPVFLKQTNSTQASTPSEAVTNGTSEPKKQHPRLFPYSLPTPRVMNVDEPYLDAEERRLVLELERRRLSLEEKRLQIEESEKNRRFCLDEKRLQMEEEDRRRTRMNEKKRLELEERRVALMEKKAEPEMRHWKMMDNFMNDALKILSQIITAVEKLQGVTKTEDLNNGVKQVQQAPLKEVDQQSKREPPLQSLPDVSETSPRRRKRKRRRSNNLDESGSSSEESGSESDTPKFSEKETAVLLKEVEEKKSVLLATSSDGETLSKKKSAWTMVAEHVSGSSGDSVERTAEDVRNVWLSLRRKSRRKCQKITTIPVNLTETERTVIRILSSDAPQMKPKS